MAPLRVAARGTLFLIWLLICVPLHVLARASRRRSPWARRFLAGSSRIFGMKVRKVGVPLTEDVLIVANHRSWLDILVLAGATGSRFVSKDDISRWPLVGWLARLNDTIFIARKKRGETLEQAETLRAALAERAPVALFPEGTTQGGDALLPFRASLFAAVSPPPPGVRVQPVLIDYGATRADLAWPNGEGAVDNMLKVLGRCGTADVTLTFLPPIDPAGRDRKAIAAKAREMMVEAMGQG